MKFTLPAWIERLLGANSAEAGEGTAWSLEHTWDLAPWLTLLAAVACVGAVLWVYIREARSSGRRGIAALAMLRIAAILVLAFMLAQVALSRQRTGLPYVAVLIDQSASMSLVDQYRDAELSERLKKLLAGVELSEPSRINLAKACLLDADGRLLRGIERQNRLKVYFVAGGAEVQAGETTELLKQIAEVEAIGESSQLGGGIRAVLDDLRGTPPAAIILLSDGITTDGETLSQAAAYARRKNVPIFTVATGTEDAIHNLKLHDLLVDEVVFVDDVVNFEYKLTGTGLEGRTVRVELKEKDKPTSLASTTVRVGQDGVPQRLSLPYRPTQVGEYRYVVSVETLADEQQKEDNAEERVVRVRKEQLKVLLVQSEPSFEYRRLKEMLARDSTIELRTVLQEADPESAATDPTALRVFPVRREELPQLDGKDPDALYHYDCVLFGDVNPAFLSSTELQNLSDYVVQRGRGIVFIAGPRYTPFAYRATPLASLFPIDMSDAEALEPGKAVNEPFVIKPTELGMTTPQMQIGESTAETTELWSRLPGMYWLFEVGRLKPGARVLAEHPSLVGREGRPLPIFLSHYVGRGRVLFHATDETFRWRYRLGDAIFARYWVQTVRAMSRTKLVGQDASAELTSDRREYRRGEAIRLRLQFFDERNSPADDDGVAVVVERAGQQNQQVALHRSATNRGVFEGVMTNAADGAYHLWVATPTFTGGAPSTDLTVVAPPGEFKTIQMDVAELKAAAQLTGGAYYTPTTASRLLGDLPEGRQVPIESLEPLVLWNKWPPMLALVCLLVAEWVLRKRKGLL